MFSVEIAHFLVNSSNISIDNDICALLHSTLLLNNTVMPQFHLVQVNSDLREIMKRMYRYRSERETKKIYRVTEHETFHQPCGISFISSLYSHGFHPNRQSAVEQNVFFFSFLI